MPMSHVATLRERLKLTQRNILHSIVFLTTISILIAAALYSSSSGSTAGLRERESPGVRSFRREPARNRRTNLRSKPEKLSIRSWLLQGIIPGPPEPTLPPDTLTTYDSDCMTPRSSFNFGDTVCAKVESNIPLAVAPRRFSWVSPDNTVQNNTDVTAVPSTTLFTLPPRDFLNDNRGTWRINSISTRASIRGTAVFTVSDPTATAADLVIYDNINTDASNVVAGSNVEFVLWLANRGPDVASNVEVTTSIGSGASFVRSDQDTGPQFSCSPNPNGTTCTVANLASGASARIRVLFQTNAGATVGSVISSSATVSSDTPDQFIGNNSSTAELNITDAGGTSVCSLICPGNVTRGASTTQGGQAGAFVTFDSAEGSGDCGTLTPSHASGSFFPVGTTTVTVNSSSGESCSFLVNVIDSAPPTISCPANVQKDAGGDCSVEVTAQELGTPTSTGNQVTVEGERSDGLALDAPYPAGNTTVTWTATDADNRTATCHQIVRVTGTDTTPPTITAPPNIEDGTGAAGAACGRIVGETELGTPTTSDNCSSVNVSRTGVPAGNFFPVGTTTITYTATDGSGNSASATQTVTITENTPPIIFAPPNATYTCLSEVPAASPGQATGPDIEVGGVLVPGPPADNCSTPVVTVSQTTNGGSGSASSPLVITRTYTATDAVGNAASAAQTITVIDPTPPTISCPANIVVHLPVNSTDTSMAVSYPAITASDNCSGGVNVVTSRASGSVFPVGTTTVTATATDAAGNSAICSFTVTVLYNFTGFFLPVNNPPTLNNVNAGRAIPVKFSLSGNKGMNIFAPDNPFTVSLNCDSGNPGVDIVETISAGSSSLNYDAASDRYNYVWATDPAWAGTCRQLKITLNDGTVHVANFRFR